jgi:hypothetical protein
MRVEYRIIVNYDEATVKSQESLITDVVGGLTNVLCNGLLSDSETIVDDWHIKVVTEGDW